MDLRQGLDLDVVECYFRIPYLRRYQVKVECGNFIQFPILICTAFWGEDYNTVKSHSSLNWNPPAHESLLQFDKKSMIN